MTGAGVDVDVALLLDGSTVVVRRLAQDDEPALRALFESTSVHNLYTRFFTVGRGMVDRHLSHLFSGSPDVTTLVVDRDGKILGVADVERCVAATSEIAFLVADDEHGQGIATLLLERAARDARRTGTSWFVADVLPINHAMIQVFNDAGYEVTMHVLGDDVSVRMSTEVTPQVVAATARRNALALSRARGEVLGP